MTFNILQRKIVLAIGTNIEYSVLLFQNIAKSKMFKCINMCDTKIDLDNMGIIIYIVNQLTSYPIRDNDLKYNRF